MPDKTEDESRYRIVLRDDQGDQMIVATMPAGYPGKKNAYATQRRLSKMLGDWVDVATIMPKPGAHR